MLRNLITVQLIAALLAGQWLCCCSALAFARNPNPHSPSARPAATGEVKRSCCGHKKAPKHDPTAPAPGPHHPTDKPGCPCKSQPSKAQLAVPESDGGQVPNGLRLAINDLNLLCSLQPAANVTRLASGTVRDPVPWAGSPTVADDLLFVHHNLRC
jgi:hypothetical protein